MPSRSHRWEVVVADRGKACSHRLRRPMTQQSNTRCPGEPPRFQLAPSTSWWPWSLCARSKPILKSTFNDVPGQSLKRLRCAVIDLRRAHRHGRSPAVWTRHRQHTARPRRNAQTHVSSQKRPQETTAVWRRRTDR